MLRTEVWPATTRHPKTGCTLRGLEFYEMLASSGKLSVFEYYQALEKMTDNTRTELPKVCFTSRKPILPLTLGL